MQIIAIEGLDKAGKYSASNFLAEYLQKHGYSVAQSEFHRYDTPTGRLIQDWLYGRYDVDQLTIELIMAADKQAQQTWFQELERQEEIDFLILDRYTTSQLVYSISSSISTYWAKMLQQQMRQPDIEFLIDIDAKTSMKRKGKYGDNDRYESDRQFLEKVRLNYLSIFENSKQKHVINGLQPMEQVHDDMAKAMHHYFWR